MVAINPPTTRSNVRDEHESCQPQASAPAADDDTDSLPWSARFDSIYRQYEHPVYRYVLRVMDGDRERALELTQDTFLRAFRAIDRCPPDLQVSPWLFRIATNVCLDEHRRRKIIQWNQLERAAQLHGERMVQHLVSEPEPAAMQAERVRLVQQTLNRITPKYRTLLVMREYQELPCEEIAEIIGTPRGAVKSLLFRAREEFRRCWTALGGTGLEG